MFFSVAEDGENHYNDLQGIFRSAFLSVPTIIDKNGAKEIVEIHMNPDELSALQRSASLLESFYDELGL